MLINCVAHQEGFRRVDLPVEDINGYLEKPRCFVWVALRDPLPQQLDAMRREFDLHPLAVADASHGHQRPKVNEYGDALFVVMQPIEFVGGALNIGEVVVFAGPNCVLSVRSGSKQHFLRVRARCEGEPHLRKQGLGCGLYALVDAVVKRYFPILEILQSKLEGIEERIFQRGATRLNIKRLHGLQRKLMQREHAVSSLLQFSGKLYGGRVAGGVCQHPALFPRHRRPPCAHRRLDRFNLFDARDHRHRDHGQAVDGHPRRGRGHQAPGRLAAWAAIFAVATAFAGIWGMHFETMPELQMKWGCPAALGLIVGTSTFLRWRLRRSGWLWCSQMPARLPLS